MRQALFAQTRENGQVECQLCAHYCRLKPGQTGPCQVRHNVGGALVTSSYGRPVFMALEPIEKKYLFHAFPGSQTLSLGTAGCNFGCKYCINWRVSQRGNDGTEAEHAPEAIIEQALAQHAECIALTYTEPTIFFEYAQDIALLAHQAGLAVVAKSNGYMTPAVLREMASWLDAINIDLKSWDETKHRQTAGGRLQPVLENLRVAAQLGLWTEVSTLIVPGLNDTRHDLQQIASFISTELGPEVPWHLLRFYPHYQMLDQVVTSQTLIQQAVESGLKAGLRHIYTKELALGQMLHTVCSRCNTILIERKGYSVISNNLLHGCCRHCGQPLKGIGLSGSQPVRLAAHTQEDTAWQNNQLPAM